MTTADKQGRTGKPRRETGSFPARTAIDDLLGDATSPQAVLQELLGERRLWWKCCSEAVRTDPSWLLDSSCKDLRAWLNATAPDRAVGSATPADHAWLLARALCASGNRDGEHYEALAGLAQGWRQSGLVSTEAAPVSAQRSGKGLEGLSPRVASRLRTVVEQIQRRGGDTVEAGESAAARNTLVIAALLMAGAKPRTRPVVRVPVVFGRSAGRTGQDIGEGVTGVLELREFPAGPAGLYPDPRAMAGVRSPNEQFAGSLGRAWHAAGPQREKRCVLWLLVLSDDPLPPARIEGPSLGAAFALGSRELLRYPPSRRPGVAWLRGLFYGLRSRTAVTGALGEGERLLKVSDMDAKLLAARRKGIRLVAPEPNRLDVANAPEPGEVKFAATLGQANRYARRFRTGRLAVALVLAAAATTTGVVVAHRNVIVTAPQNTEALARLTTAHRLVEVSRSLLPSDVGLAELFAVQGYRYHPDPLTRAALFQAATASPHLAGSVQASGSISALSSSGNEKVVLAGTQQGAVQQWALAGVSAGPAGQLGRLPGPVTAVAADTDGGTVAAIDHSTVRVWAAGQPVAAPRVPAEQRPTTVGVSPSGRFVAVTTTTEQHNGPYTMWVLDQTTGNTRRLGLDLQSDPTAIAFPGDSEVVTFDGSGGSWERISLPALARTAGNEIYFGVHSQASALSPDGGYFSYTNGASALPIWQAKGSPDFDKPDRTAQTQPGGPVALALSSGTLAAEAVGATIYVSPTAKAGETPPGPITLTGAGQVSPGALAFLGHGSKLLSASGDMLSLWDLDQRSRIATETPVAIPPSCNACGAPAIALSPDGRSAAVIDGNRGEIEVRDLDQPRTTLFSSKGSPLDGSEFAAVLWQKDGSGLIAVSSDGSAKILSRAKDFQVIGSWPPVPDSFQRADPALHVQFLPDGRQIAEVGGLGTIRFRDAATGKVLRRVDGLRNKDPVADADASLPQGWAALDPTAGHAAMIDREGAEIVVTDTLTGHSRTIPGADADGVVYLGEHLFVQRKSGRLEIWSASGDQRFDTIEGTPGTSVGPVGGRDLIAEKPGDDTVRLIDLQTGHSFGTLALPAGNKAQSTGLAISVDGSALITATEAQEDTAGDVGTLIGWRLDPNSWTRSACTSAGRDLTPDVWKHYTGTDAPSNLHCPG